MDATVFSLVFRSGTHGIRTRNIDISVCQLSHVPQLLGTSCCEMHILTCRFLDDPPSSRTYKTSLPPVLMHNLDKMNHVLTLLCIWFISFSLFNTSSVFNPSIHHPWHPFNMGAFFLSSFLILQTLQTREIQINNHSIYALIIYWEMSALMRIGSCIEGPSVPRHITIITSRGHPMSNAFCIQFPKNWFHFFFEIFSHQCFPIFVFDNKYVLLHLFWPFQCFQSQTYFLPFRRLCQECLPKLLWNFPLWRRRLRGQVHVL